MNTLVKPDLRERVLERGISYPSDEELIMLIIGSGSKDERVEELSEKILRVTDCFSSEKLVPELLKIKGVGHSKALRESGSRFLEFVWILFAKTVQQ